MRPPEPEAGSPVRRPMLLHRFPTAARIGPRSQLSRGPRRGRTASAFTVAAPRHGVPLTPCEMATVARSCPFFIWVHQTAMPLCQGPKIGLFMAVCLEGKQVSPMILSQIQHDKQIPQHLKKGWILDGLGLDKMNYAVL